MEELMLKKYAELAIVKGCNVQKNQLLIINAPINACQIVRACVDKAYECGAKRVKVNYYDPEIERLDFLYAQTEELCNIPNYVIDAKTIPLKEGACILNIISDIPENLKNLDSKKIALVNNAKDKSFVEANEIIMASKVQWSIIGYPNKKWAKKVFPDLDEEKAYKRLESEILNSCYIDADSDSIKTWDNHERQLSKIVEKLNTLELNKLVFKNSLGTDITIELVKNHLWAGGNEKSYEGVIFNANMPTEEVFGMPYKYGVNGTVISSKPLSYNGQVIDKFKLVFKNGKVISYQAENNESVLKDILESDEGSCYLGEVALVPFHSPISLSNILFYETLYDENASCHLALGRAYPINVQNGSNLKQQDLDEIGSNNSSIHVDFMFGSEDLKVIGSTKNGEDIIIIDNGDFVI